MSHSHEHMSNGCEASGCEHDHHNCEDHGHEHGHDDKKQQSTLPAAVETRLFNLRANACLDKDDFMGAAREAYQGLEVLPDVANLLVAKGRALLAPLLDKVMNDREWNRGEFKEIWEAFRLAHLMDESNAQAFMELERLTELMRRLPEDQQWYLNNPDPRQQAPAVVPVSDVSDADAATQAAKAELPDPSPEASSLDVLIVGAGAAGIGTAFMLTHVFGLDASRVLLVERGEAVGSSFRQWPAEMRFISPSFNQQGWTNSFDLNSIAYGTSPAYTLHAQHPSREEYATYLSELSKAAKMNVRLNTEVLKVDVSDDGDFHVLVRNISADGATNGGETLKPRFVVWAAGEFQYPREGAGGAIGGSELCLHNSRVRSWAKLPGDDFVIIGGYESGADACFNLAKAGKKCTMLASTASWNVMNTDPSTELAPYTADRLRQVTAAGFSPRPKLLAPLRVLRVERAQAGGFNVVAQWKAPESFEHGAWRLRKQVEETEEAIAPGAEGTELVVHTAQPPILATGFVGSVAASARHLFNLADESDAAKGCLAGAPLLTKDDESTKTPGVFLVGPTVRHGELSFCFIYKFRQRFGIVANAICKGLGRDTEAAVENCKNMNMYMDDFQCCKSTCGEAC